MNATISQRNREIKKELSKIYGAKNVRVQGGTGTAYGWLNIKVKQTTPAGHIHNINQFGRCTSCWENGRVEENKIRGLAHDVAKKIGSYIGSYYSDDGYDTKRDTMIVEVQYIDPVKKIEMTPAEEGEKAAKEEASQYRLEVIFDALIGASQIELINQFITDTGLSKYPVTEAELKEFVLQVRPWIKKI